MISRKDMKEKFERNPMIIAVKDNETMRLALGGSHEIIFILDGDIMTIEKKVTSLLSLNKIPFIHIDMVIGLSSSPVIIDYIADKFNKQCGIITTKPNLMKRAIENDLRVVHRVFAVDSKSIEMCKENLKRYPKPDAIEIMPGILPKVIKRMKEDNPNTTLIAGGLLTEKKEAYEALMMGATSISTSCIDLIKEEG